MERRLTPRPGYFILVLLLAAALLALLLWRGCRQEAAIVGTAPVDTALLAQLDSQGHTPQSQRHTPQSRRHTPQSLRDSSPNLGEQWLSRSSARSETGGISGCPPKLGGLSAPLTEECVKARYPRKTSRTIDLNTADTLDLQQLPGIGPVFARRIVRYRSLLGGFVDKEQLREVYGLQDSVYRRIAPRVTVADTQAIARLDINTATFKQLVSHPYLDKYQAAAILDLRRQRGAYSTVEELHQIPIIESETYNKIAPYISCSLQQQK